MNHPSFSSYVVLPSHSPERESDERPAVDVLHPGTGTG
jgi:hypothetical protein